MCRLNIILLKIGGWWLQEEATNQIVGSLNPDARQKNSLNLSLKSAVAKQDEKN